MGRELPACVRCQNGLSRFILALVCCLDAAIQAQTRPAVTPAPKFEIASIKPGSACEQGEGGRPQGITASPGRLSIGCQTVEFLIREAYLAKGRPFLFVSGTLYTQPIKGSPAWIGSERYSIDARAGSPQRRETMLGPMMQTLLEDRFKLKVHYESREMPAYELTLGKDGPTLETAKERGCAPFDVDKPQPPAGSHLCGVLVRSVNPAVPSALYGATIGDLCRALGRLLDREVTNRTGITGTYDIRLELSPRDLFPRLAALQAQMPSDADGAAASAGDPGGASIFAAIQKLGLRLVASKATTDFLVIDHVERPSEN